MRFPEELYEDTLNIKTEKKRLENRVGSGGVLIPKYRGGKGRFRKGLGRTGEPLFYRSKSSQSSEVTLEW